MKWIENKRLVIFLSIACLFACLFAAYSFVKMHTFTGQISVDMPSSWAKYEIAIIEKYPCATEPNKFMIEIENKGLFPIKSYHLEPILVKTTPRPQALNPRKRDNRFMDGRTCSLANIVENIQPGEKGYIYTSISPIVPGGLPTEMTLRLCLEEQYESCQTEHITYIAKTPYQDPLAVSEMELSFAGVITHPCLQKETFTAVFNVKNSGESVLMRLTHEANELNNGRDTIVGLIDNWQECNLNQQHRRGFLQPSEESTLLLTWDTQPTPGTLVETTLTMCPATHYYVDNTIPCTSHADEFYIPED